MSFYKTFFSPASQKQILGAAILFSAVFFSLSSVCSAAEMFRLREPGEMLPEIELFDLNGDKHSLKLDDIEAPTIIFFWSVYCPVCKEAIPGMLKLYQNCKEQGLDLDVWAVNVDGDRFSNAVVSFSKEMTKSFTVLYDRLEGDFLVAADPLGVSKTPTLYLADSDGRIVLRQVVQVDYEAVDKTLKSLSSR